MEQQTDMEMRAKLAQKLAIMAREIGNVPKDKENTFHHYWYASDQAVMSAISAKCFEVGVASIPHYEVTLEERDGKARFVRIKMTLDVIDTETGFLMTSGPFLGTGQDTGDKADPKAMTMALKYAWLKTLNLPTGDDAEADIETDKRGAEKDKKPAAKKPTDPKLEQPKTERQPMTDAQRVHMMLNDTGIKADEHIKWVNAWLDKQKAGVRVLESIKELEKYPVIIDGLLKFLAQKINFQKQQKAI